MAAPYDRRGATSAAGHRELFGAGEHAHALPNMPARADGGSRAQPGDDRNTACKLCAKSVKRGGQDLPGSWRSASSLVWRAPDSDRCCVACAGRIRSDASASNKRRLAAPVEPSRSLRSRGAPESAPEAGRSGYGGWSMSGVHGDGEDLSRESRRFAAPGATPFGAGPVNHLASRSRQQGASGADPSGSLLDGAHGGASSSTTDGSVAELVDVATSGGQSMLPHELGAVTSQQAAASRGGLAGKAPTRIPEAVAHRLTPGSKTKLSALNTKELLKRCGLTSAALARLKKADGGRRSALKGLAIVYYGGGVPVRSHLHI